VFSRLTAQGIEVESPKCDWSLCADGLGTESPTRAVGLWVVRVAPN